MAKVITINRPNVVALIEEAAKRLTAGNKPEAVALAMRRVEVDVIEVNSEVPIIPNRMLPIPPLPDAAFTAAAHDGRSRFGGGQGFHKRDLDRAPTAGKV